MKGKIILCVVLVIILGAIGYVSTFGIKKIKVTGCIMSSEEEVRKSIESYALINNTLVLCIQSKIKPIEKIPFVTKVDIDREGKNTIVVEVYEKSVAGCIEYMENYVYFDREGIVLETSKDKFDGVPYIKGLTVKSWQLNEELPIENKKKFDTILTITQLIDKYELQIQGIEFTIDGEVVLWHDNIEIELGNGENLPIQMMNLGSILEGIEGKTGVLYMKEYSAENATASFKIR